MSAIEISCFQIDSSEVGTHSEPFLAGAPLDQPTATLRFYLTHGIRVLSKGSKHPFYLLQDLEDPLILYYVGKWASLEAYSAWFTTKERAELVADLTSAKATMQWKGLYEISDYENWEKSMFSGLLHRRKDALEARYVGITRANVAPEDVREFELKLSNGRPSFEKFSNYKTACGRRSKRDFEEDIQTTGQLLTKDDVRDEFMILGGWESKKRYDDFPDSEEYRKYMQIRDDAKWFERKLALLIHLE